MKYQSEVAYVVSWETFISAIKRRKYLGEKTVDELTEEDIEILRTEIEAILDEFIEGLLEMSFEAYELVQNL